MERARFKAYLEAFEQQLRAEGKSANTLTSYTRDVREFLEFLAASSYGEVLDELTEHHVAAFVASLQGRELAQRSKAKKLTSIRSFLLFCRRNGLLNSYPQKLTFAKIKPLVAKILAEQERQIRAAASGAIPEPIDGEEVTEPGEDVTGLGALGQLRNTRKFIRVPFYGEVRVKPTTAPEEDWYLGYAFEVGRGGIGIKVAYCPPGGTEMDLVLQLDPAGEPFRLRGKVAFFDDMNVEYEKTRIARVGIEFTDVAPEVAQRITDWVADEVTRLRAEAIVRAELRAKPTPEEIRVKYEAFKRFKGEHLIAGQNTRQFVRVPLDADARMRVAGSGEVFEGVTLDVGVNGLSIKSRSCPADDGARLTIEFDVGVRSVVVGGRIVSRVDFDVSNNRIRTTRLGIQFTDVSDSAAALIAEYIRSRLATRVSPPPVALRA